MPVLYWLAVVILAAEGVMYTVIRRKWRNRRRIRGTMKFFTYQFVMMSARVGIYAFIFGLGGFNWWRLALAFLLVVFTVATAFREKRYSELSGQDDIKHEKLLVTGTVLQLLISLGVLYLLAFH